MRRLYSFLLLGACVTVLICLMALCAVRQRLVLSVSGFDLIGTDSMTVGKGSAVCFHQVPHDFLTISREGGELSWRVSERCLKQDSLCYFKINDVNPNLHPLSEGDRVVVSVKGRRYELPVASLDELLGGHESQYVMVRNALERRRQQEGDSLSPDFANVRAIRSVFFRTRSSFRRRLGDWQLVILDRNTTIETPQQTISYATSGQAGQHCKVQFYRMAEYTFKSSDDDLFQVDGINCMAKPVLLSTEWGSGHAMLRPSDDGMSVRYPKPLTYTEDYSLLKEMAKENAFMLTLSQQNGDLPVGHHLFVPPFSSSLPVDVCQLTLTGKKLQVEGKTMKPRWGLLPDWQPMQLTDVGSRVYMHTAVIGMGFILSYLWLPLLMLLLVFFAYPPLVRVRGVRGSPSYQSSRLPQLFRLVAVIAFGYAVARTMVVLKLSWTYPYFEKLTGVSVVSSGLMMMLLFELSLLINHDFLATVGRNRRGQWRKWIAVLLSLAGLALCVGAMVYTDRHFSRMMLEAYQPHEVWVLNPLRWTQSDGINDLHRSVPYTLLLLNAVAILALIVRNILGIRRQRQAVFKAPGWLESRVGKGNASALSMAVVYALLVAAASMIPGNFSTAFITLFVVIGMGHSLALVDYGGRRPLAFLTSFVISLIMLMAAIILPMADKGYFTNYLGFACLIVFLYVIVGKYGRMAPGPKELEANRQEKRWMNILLGGVMVVMVIVVPQAMRLYYQPDNVDYSRKTRRFLLFSQFDEYRNSGYRYAVSDTEFMTVMVHGMYNLSGKDPLSPERHVLHPSVSTGQSPVVLNDVSLPSAFFGTYGWSAYLVYFSLMVLLIIAVVAYSLPSKRQMDLGSEIDVRTIWRLLAVMMWAGTSFYLYLSYVGRFPFTGRLNPGFGVDSVGEALESVILLAFMTATLLGKSPSTRTKISRR